MEKWRICKWYSKTLLGLIVTYCRFDEIHIAFMSLFYMIGFVNINNCIYK
jgi:hypothetical protein